MIERIITAKALDMLRLVMRGCPKSPTNGGDKARHYFHRRAQNTRDISVREFIAEVKSWRDAVKTPKNEELLGSMYDVYCDVINTADGDVDEKSIIDFFAGQLHARKILRDIENEKEYCYSELYRQKMLFAHVLIPLKINGVKENRYFGIYETGNGLIEMSNLLRYAESSEQINKGETVLAHYGFVLKKAEEKEHSMILSANNSSELIIKACEELSGGEIDFENMHYFPRSLKIAAEVIE